MTKDLQQSILYVSQLIERHPVYKNREYHPYLYEIIDFLELIRNNPYLNEHAFFSEEYWSDRENFEYPIYFIKDDYKIGIIPDDFKNEPVKYRLKEESGYKYLYGYDLKIDGHLITKALEDILENDMFTHYHWEYFLSLLNEFTKDGDYIKHYKLIIKTLKKLKEYDLFKESRLNFCLWVTEIRFPDTSKFISLNTNKKRQDTYCDG